MLLSRKFRSLDRTCFHIENGRSISPVVGGDVIQNSPGYLAEIWIFWRIRRYVFKLHVIDFN